MSFFSNFQIANLIKAKDLRKRLAFTFYILVLYRFASYIPLPGIDFANIAALKERISGSFFGMFDVLSGGSLSRMTIMALNIGPYISSSILFQLLGAVSPYFANLKKQGEFGKAKIAKYIKYGALILSIAQGYGLATALELMKESSELVMFPGIWFRLLTCFVFCCSTMIVMWFGEQITSRGIGNGSSVIIYTGIVANLPNAIFKLFEMGKNGEISVLKVIAVCLIVLFLFCFIVFVERIERLVRVIYTKKQISSTVIMDGRTAFLPIKLNPAGVLPPIFASTILTVPPMLLNFFGVAKYEWGEYLLSQLVHGSWLFTFLYGVLIYSVSYIYSSMFFDCKETADNLNKNGGFVKGIRPGMQTVNFLEDLLLKISSLGGLYLVFICVIPEIMMSQALVSLYFSGTSFIIVVGVAVDFIERVKTAFLTLKYEKLFKKGYGGLL